MFCCACNGSCNHIGPHSYCSAHGGQPMVYLPPITGTSLQFELAQPTLDAERIEELFTLAEKLMSALASVRAAYEEATWDNPDDDLRLLHLGHAEALIHRARMVLYGLSTDADEGR